MKKLIVLGFLSLCLALQINAQKFGYINSQALLAEMSEVKQADSNLEALQTQLQKKGQNMVETWQRKAQELAQKRERGDLSPNQLDAESKKLQEEQNKILGFEQDMQNQLLKKREELLGPILERVNVAIKDVASENGFSYIFDSSAGILLYADESTDVTAMVKAKLGI